MPRDPRLPPSEWRSYQGTITTLAVGEQAIKYKVHETLLCAASQFFASASKEEWKAGQKHRIPLPDDETSVVDLYVQWLYTRRIIIHKRSVEEGKDGKDEKVVTEEEQWRQKGEEGVEGDQEECKNGHEFDVLIGAFVFGEKVQDGDFKDAVVDALIYTVAAPDEKGVRWYPTAQSVDRAYTGTPEGSPIRRLLVDMYTFHGRKVWLDGQKNVDFLAGSAMTRTCEGASWCDQASSMRTTMQPPQ